MSGRLRQNAVLLIALAGALAFAIYGNAHRRAPQSLQDELDIIPPLLVQLALAAGDRFLAANINTWRATMVSSANLPPATIKGLARLQTDASWFNPGQEDNYYTATAILPWEGEVQATQTILARAEKGRPNDLYPAFYFGFNQIHFLGDGRGAAQAAIRAAERADDEASKDALRAIAARWSEKGEDLGVSIRLLRGMAENTKDYGLRHQLLNRAASLEGLKLLREAAQKFTDERGEKPKVLDDLVFFNYLAAIPSDPLRRGYRLENGQPEFRAQNGNEGARK